MEILTAELHEALDNQRLTPIKNQISAQRTSTQDIPQNTWEELLGCKEQRTKLSGSASTYKYCSATHKDITNDHVVPTISGSLPRRGDLEKDGTCFHDRGTVETNQCPIL